MSRVLLAAGVALTGLLAWRGGCGGCGRASESSGDAGSATGKALVLVEVSPLVSLVEGLVGEGVQVRSLAPAGGSAHGYQLTPEDAVALSTADLVVLVGPTVEPAAIRAVEQQTPPERVFRIGDALRIVPGNAGHDHAQEEHGHDGHGVDPHLWLDPALMSRFVDALGDELERRGLAGPDPARKIEDMQARIDAVDHAYRQRLAPFAGRAVITQHDAFRRVADRYGLKIGAVLRPVNATEPTPGDLARVIDAARAHAVGAVFVEPGLPDAAARRIAERLGLEVHTLDAEASADWFALMSSNLDALVAGLSAPAPAPKGADTEASRDPEGDG